MYEQIIHDMEHDDLLNYLLQDYVEFEEWKDAIASFLSECYPFEQLQVIVLGSSGIDRFNSDFAFLAQEHPYGRVPRSVLNLIDIRNNAFGYCYPSIIDRYGNHVRRDHGFMFINVCLSNDPDDNYKAICTIQFINRVLRAAEHRNRHLAVLDMRLCKHIHVDELNENLQVDRDFMEFCQSNQLFKIINSQTFHHVRRLGHPSNYDEDDLNYVANQLLALDRVGFQMKCIYRRHCQ